MGRRRHCRRHRHRQQQRHRRLRCLRRSRRSRRSRCHRLASQVKVSFKLSLFIGNLIYGLFAYGFSGMRR